MSRQQWRQGRMCTVCGEAAGRKAVCGRCDPSRGTRPHVDKYATTPDNVDGTGKAVDIHPQPRS